MSRSKRRRRRLLIDRIATIQEHAEKYQLPGPEYHVPEHATQAIAKCVVELCFNLRQYYNEEAIDERESQDQT